MHQEEIVYFFLHLCYNFQLKVLLNTYQEEFLSPLKTNRFLKVFASKVDNTKTAKNSHYRATTVPRVSSARNHAPSRRQSCHEWALRYVPKLSHAAKCCGV